MKHFNNKLLSHPLNRALCVIALSCASIQAVAIESPSVNSSTVNTSEEKFPEIKYSYLKTGKISDQVNVDRIIAGLNKDQVRSHLGNPHFSEGLFGVKTWDYAFRLYTGQGNEYVTCQYKIKFDNDYLVESTHWKDSQCENYIKPSAPVVATAPVIAVPPQEKKIITIQSDGLFAFNKANIDSMTSPDRKKLADLATQLKQSATNLTMITVTGYTDQIGSDAANLALSQARANTIRSYLVQQGIDDKLIRAYGAGASNLVKESEDKKVTPELVAYLQPNRRVEIEVLQVK